MDELGDPARHVSASSDRVADRQTDLPRRPLYIGLTPYRSPSVTCPRKASVSSRSRIVSMTQVRTRFLDDPVGRRVHVTL